MMHILESCGLTPAKLEMGVWFDEEDGDGYKERNEMPTAQTITAMCNEFIAECNRHGYNCGLYASLDWLMEQYNKIVADILDKGRRKACLVNFISALKKQKRTIVKFDEDIWCSLVVFVTVGRKKEIKVTFRDGTEIMA